MSWQGVNGAKALTAGAEATGGDSDEGGQISQSPYQPKESQRTLS